MFDLERVDGKGAYGSVKSISTFLSLYYLACASLCDHVNCQDLNFALFYFVNIRIGACPHCAIRSLRHSRMYYRMADSGLVTRNCVRLYLVLMEVSYFSDREYVGISFTRCAYYATVARFILNI